MKEGTFVGISQYSGANLASHKLNKLVVFEQGRGGLNRTYHSGLRKETAYGSFSTVKQFNTRGYGNPRLEIIYD
jgi:hypothetical protein